MAVGDRDGDVALCLGIGMSLNLRCKSYKTWVNVGVRVISSCRHGGRFRWRGRNPKKTATRIYSCIIRNHSRCGAGIAETPKAILLWRSFPSAHSLYRIIRSLEKTLPYNSYCRAVHVIPCSHPKITATRSIHPFLTANYCSTKPRTWSIHET